MHVAYVVIGVLMKEFTDMDSVNWSVDVFSRFVHL